MKVGFKSLDRLGNCPEDSFSEQTGEALIATIIEARGGDVAMFRGRSLRIHLSTAAVKQIA